MRNEKLFLTIKRTWRAWSLIEVDGDSHFTESGLAYDAERTVFLEGLGLRVVRFTNAQILENFDGVCAELRVILG